MPTRRHVLGGLAAAPLLSRAAWAEVGAPTHVAAARRGNGSYALFGMTGVGDVAFEVPLPDRGHAAAAHPVRAEAVAFARRPGTFALVIDCADGRVLRRLDSPPGRHFYGHGAYDRSGDMLLTTENDYESGEGRIGIWDVGAGYLRIGEVPSGGIGPHEILRLPGTDRFVVANGGLRTHPDSDREVLNPDTMRPNLSFLSDGSTDRVVELEPALRRNSIRHLAARRDGTVAAALQWQGDLSEVVPLLALMPSEGPVRLLADADPGQAELQGYAGSVAFDGAGGRVAITSPRGGLAQIWEVASPGEPQILRRPDICGVARAAEGFVFSDGGGGWLTAPAPQVHPVAWDNHIVSLLAG
ncbi:DUF1513 domain-containing protein [Wenxinia saemankumensis]|uniref:Twin-arginine translocation pathway signal n=1 Tax=Wenxinia saemankumensis TaxID=1447782 RepID=A0A1M6B670_9RHOB|nr:DUF1513 domain-containing protein [Wenxinia saemankumensis]SHI44068.1 hypothetical protein SAMN05444417_0794 [Wenxinia saemankumensis]